MKLLAWIIIILFTFGFFYLVFVGSSTHLDQINKCESLNGKAVTDRGIYQFCIKKENIIKVPE